MDDGPPFLLCELKRLALLCIYRRFDPFKNFPKEEQAVPLTET